MKTILKSNWLSCLVILGVTVFGAISYPHLPTQFAARFGWTGEPQNYIGPMLGVALLPLIMLLVVWLIPFLIRISPQGFQMEQSLNSVARLNFAVVTALSVLYVGEILFNLDPHRYPMLFFIRLFCVVFLVTYGNFLSKTERNFFIGVRTPWSLVSQRNWFATHRFAAKIAVLAGFVLLLLFPFELPIGIVLGVFITSLFLPFGYSYWFYRQREGAV